jgi:hypothetical protein
MRFMIIVKASPESEAGAMPTSEELAAMGRFNEELIDAGVLLAAEGLRDSAKGARVKKVGGKVVVTDGPFAETKEQLGGFLLIDVPDLNEAIRVAAQFPAARFGSVEVRPIKEHGCA